MKLEPSDIEALDDQTVEALRKRLGLDTDQLTRTTPYSLKEAANLLNTSTETLRVRVHAGKIGRVPNIGSIRIPASEMNRLLKGETAA